MKKLGMILVTILLVLMLGALALAEGSTDTAAESAATDTTASDAAAADALAQAESDAKALEDALTAYRTAKQESRKQAVLDSLKQELDSYVAAGSLTSDQADLLLKYYAEQLAQNSGLEGRHGKGFRHGLSNQNGHSDQNGNPNGGFGRGRKHGRTNPNQTVSAAPQGTQSAPDAGAGI